MTFCFQFFRFMFSYIFRYFRKISLSVNLIDYFLFVLIILHMSFSINFTKNNYEKLKTKRHTAYFLYLFAIICSFNQPSVRLQAYYDCTQSSFHTILRQVQKEVTLRNKWPNNCSNETRSSRLP